MKKNINIMTLVMNSVEWSCHEYDNTLRKIFGEEGSAVVTDRDHKFSPEGIVKLKNELHKNMEDITQAGMLICLNGAALVNRTYYMYGWFGVSYLESSIKVDAETGFVYSHEHPSWEVFAKRFIRNLYMIGEMSPDLGAINHPKVKEDAYILGVQYFANRIAAGEIVTEVKKTIGYKDSEVPGEFWAWRSSTKEDRAVDKTTIDFLRETIWLARLMVDAGNELVWRARHQKKEA